MVEEPKTALAHPLGDRVTQGAVGEGLDGRTIRADQVVVVAAELLAQRPPPRPIGEVHVRNDAGLLQRGEAAVDGRGITSALEPGGELLGRER